MPGIVIVDYGMANLRSVQKAFERVGHAAEISADPAVIAAADRLVVPGVGAFQDAIARLNEIHLADPIRSHVNQGKPFLGICLGMQLLFDRSEEDGIHTGLGIVPGAVVRFDAIPGLKVPHMGWNQLDFPNDCPLFRGIAAGSAVYFVHSYYAQPTDPTVVAATANYPTPFTAAIWRENLYATQFHPEKSQTIGMTMLKNFAEVC